MASGVRSGKFHITVDFIGNVFRTSTAGSSERNSYVLDWVHGLIGYVRLAFLCVRRAIPTVLSHSRLPCRSGGKLSILGCWDIATSTANTCRKDSSARHHNEICMTRIDSLRSVTYTSLYSRHHIEQARVTTTTYILLYLLSLNESVILVR